MPACRCGTSSRTGVLEQFAPAHVVVNRDGDVVHFSTRTGKYLESAPGAPTRQYLSRWRGADCGPTCGRRCARRSRRGAGSSAAGLHVEIDDRVQFLDLTIEPLPDHDAEPLFLVVFCRYRRADGARPARCRR